MESFGNSFVESADLFLDELSECSSTATDRQSFYRRLIDRLQNLLNADDISVWARQRDQHYLRVIQQRIREPNASAIDLEGECIHQDVESVCTERLDDGKNSVIAIPIEVENEERKIISLTICDSLDSRLAKVYCDLCDAVGDIAVNFERRLAARNQQQRFAKLEAFVQLQKNSSESLELERVGFNLTNDCRSFLNASRVWLFSTDGRLKLVACSSVNAVNPRSRSFRNLESVVAGSIRLEEPVSHVAGEMGNSNGVQVAEYVDTESLNGVYVRLLKRPKSLTHDGVLVVEFFEPHDPMSVLNSLNNIVPCVESAVSNAVEFKKIPFRQTLQKIRWLTDKLRLQALPKTLVFLATLCGLAAAAFLVQADFEIEVIGELRPVIERNVFAPVDSTVDKVFVDYGDVVSKGQAIASLVSNDYDLKIDSLQNDLSAAQKGLEANQILHAQASNEGKDSLYLSQLTAEMEQARLEIDAISQEVAWFQEKADKLEVKAPVAGTVVSRDVKMSLLKRPVNAGNQLLTIADTGDQWRIVFEVPDREFGYLLNAKRQNDVQDWYVKYRFQSDLETTHKSIIERTDENNSFDSDGNAFVKAYVPIANKEESGNQYRVGQTVIGKVNCGRKSLFYIWTRDVRDFLNSNFFWM